MVYAGMTYINRSFFFSSFNWYISSQHKPSMMKNKEDLKWCLSIMLKRQFYIDRWIGDETILSILHETFNLCHINKSYLNKYLKDIVFDKMNCFRHSEERINYKNINIRRAYFYYFSRSNIVPNILSKQSFIDCYFNTKQMRINCNEEKRNVLNDMTNLVYNNDNGDASIVSPPDPKRRRATILDVIGNWFSSTNAKNLFCVRDSETVYDCLSRRIDLFNDIINSKKCLTSIVNRATEKLFFEPTADIQICTKNTILKKCLPQCS